MNILKRISLIVACFILLGCQYPGPTKITYQDSRPSIQINEAPKGSVLFVDGIKITSFDISNFENEAVLVEQGRHHIKIIDIHGKILFEEEIYLGPSVRKVITLQ